MSAPTKPKGQHGGPRANSGGARPNSGPKPKEMQKLPATPDMDPLAFLLSVQNDGNADPALRIRAATAAARLMADGGGKKAKKARDAAAATGKFVPSAPPKLVVSNGR